MNLNRVRTIDNFVAVKTALVSVADKAGLPELARGLVEHCPGIIIYSTGGTYSQLEKILSFTGQPKAGGCLRQISEYTGHSEMQGGLVKTLDYRIYLGLLSETYNPAHQEDLRRIEARAFDLVVANLYPFSEAASADGASLEDARANIDIGGPCMLRAAAKNFLRVAALCRPADYAGFLDELKAAGGRTRLATRWALAQKVFRHTADYDEAIARRFARISGEEASSCYELKD